MTRALEILLLCDRRQDGAAAAREHIDRLAQGSRHRVRVLSVFGALPARLDLDRFDCVIVHYTLMADPERLLPERVRGALARCRGIKAVLVQDEHRNVARRIASLREMGTGVLFTCVPAPETGKVYPEAQLPGVRKVSVLTGYVSPDLGAMAVPRFGDRPLDVGYRARQLPAWLGRLAWEKAEIGRRFANDAARHGLACDISVAEHDRIYGAAWTAFLTRCKATLGSESGASVFDWDGSVEARVDAHVARHPDATFEELSAAHFATLDGQVANAQVSPRVFEAAALRTLMVHYPGSYSGVLQAWQHYVPLARDHSNMDEVVAVLRDPERAEPIIERAYREVALNPAYSFAAMNALMDEAIAEAAAGRTPARPYSGAEWALVARSDWRSETRRMARTARDGTVRMAFRALSSLASPAFAEQCKSRLRRLRSRWTARHGH